MPAIAIVTPTLHLTAIALPTQRAVATVLLLATAVVLVAFGSVVSHITNQADLARDADMLVRHARIECETHVLAGQREKCRQSLPEAVL